MSVGFGVFMGIVPLWGLQMLIAIAISVLLRFNKVLVLIAANISFPPLIPFILYLSHVTGKLWMGKKAVTLSFEKGFDLEMMQSSIVQYLLGATTLAFISGLVFGLATYVALIVFKRKASNG